jgi:phosphoglycerol geranylgeranyltransferase
MDAGRLGRRLYRGVEFLGVVGRQLLGEHTNPVPRAWSHVTKVDPEATKRLPLLFPAYLDHTSAVSVGGSRNVTASNTEETFRVLEHASPPAFHEPSAADHVTERTREAALFLAIPEVLNGDVESIVGTIGEGIARIHDEMVPSKLRDELPGWALRRWEGPLTDLATSWMLANSVFEGYVIQNPDSAAAREAGVGPDDRLDPPEARRRAMAAERRLGTEVVYLEYSGTYGGAEAGAVLQELSDALRWSRLWYGGGLRNGDDAEAMLAAGADAVVVGDVFHDIAAEEVATCRAAEAQLPPAAGGGVVADWVRDNVDVEASAARQYLSTIPDVTDPDALAERYLRATVSLWQILGELQDEVRSGRPDGARREQLVARRAVAPATKSEAIRAVFADGGASFVGRLAEGVIADRTPGSPGSDLAVPVGPLSIARRARTDRRG